ncbi:hypothetical protein [Sessilibacter corallicola]|uniref:hypothetical protein n=1 Tax=Sessilibacter corallicola TaxID=2904075 RepID=UPI001E41D0DD|nr:hypothetical protein [Sessilibacter corallicola]MCE2027690.1 hypothetical protein [Sessilibacter corallicola]
MSIAGKANKEFVQRIARDIRCLDLILSNQLYLTTTTMAETTPNELFNSFWHTSHAGLFFAEINNSG